ncbi:hypothetical protein TNCV_1600471 [Trichonephila clavipes]|nr:hypothetical protein TNCV_1600471 [Trichonephila clavipes]
MEAGWSVQRVARQVGRSELSVRSYWQYLHYGSCVFLNHLKAPGCRTSVIVASFTCPTYETHPLTPPFGLVSWVDNGIGLQRKGARSSSAMNLDSI